uniref:Uncharacterized protein n=1 Tax=Arundo donax TaxID=35708 RepID=A0A0A9G0R0_ARUDO
MCVYRTPENRAVLNKRNAYRNRYSGPCAPQACRKSEMRNWRKRYFRACFECRFTPYEVRQAKSFCRVEY